MLTVSVSGQWVINHLVYVERGIKSFITVCVSLVELVALKSYPQGRKERRLCSSDSLKILIKCPSCAPKQEVLLTWMNGCVRGRSARDLWAQECVRFIGAAG